MMSENEIPYKKLKTEVNHEEESSITQEAEAADPEEIELNTTLVPSSQTNATIASTSIPQQRPKLAFKNPKFSYIEPGGKKFIWKSLKQIVSQEKSFSWPEDVVLCKFCNILKKIWLKIYFIVDNSLNAPPSLKPAKKYSDISGLEAAYTDPQTKLYYHNAEEFRIIRTLPSDIIQGYLALRGATNIVG